jgi:hypothetical protein
MAQKGHNFSSDRWNALKFLKDFSKIVLLGVPMESLHTEEEV